jgi:hypothetical protein
MAANQLAKTDAKRRRQAWRKPLWRLWLACGVIWRSWRKQWLFISEMKMAAALSPMAQRNGANRNAAANGCLAYVPIIVCSPQWPWRGAKQLSQPWLAGSGGLAGLSLAMLCAVSMA